ncbi:MAG: hypothetical protein H8E42_04425 [Nitrospinae bacterium]|nr:hypothetical protein [Nitrospinota bacterium]MBL7020142.1 hypothetical protein [Nitrospinaceae bacterium]
MTVRHSCIRKIIFLFLVCFITSCAVLKEERTFSKSGLTVTFRSLNFLDDVQNVEFRYPIILSEEQVRNHLLSLWHRNIVSPEKPKPVFSFDEVTELAPLFKTVLKKVAPGKYLHFIFQASGGLTEGQVFAASNKIHWRFLRINNTIYSNDPLRLRKPTWELVRMHGQAYQKLQTGGFKKSIKNWIIADTNLPFPKQRSQPLSPTKTSPGSLTQSKTEKPELKHKLDTLQKLLDAGLIDEGEHRKKQEALLNQYFEVHD